MAKRLVDILVETTNAEEEVDWLNVVLPLITTEAAREKGSEGWPAYEELPIHLAVCNKAPLVVVVALLEAHIEGVREKDGLKRLPLYCATSNDAPAEVIAALRKAMSSVAEAGLQSYLDAAVAEDKDKEGRRALHRALEDLAPASVVMAVMDANPAAVRYKDDVGKLPLHRAAESDAPFEVVAALLSAYPAAARVKDKLGKLPLHHAAENKAPFEVMAALLSAYPEAARVKDKLGRLPLHHAAENEAPLEVVAALLSAYPEAARECWRQLSFIWKASPSSCCREQGSPRGRGCSPIGLPRSSEGKRQRGKASPSLCC